VNETVRVARADPEQVLGERLHERRLGADAFVHVLVLVELEEAHTRYGIERDFLPRQRAIVLRPHQRVEGNQDQAAERETRRSA